MLQLDAAFGLELRAEGDFQRGNFALAVAMAKAFSGIPRSPRRWPRRPL